MVTTPGQRAALPALADLQAIDDMLVAARGHAAALADQLQGRPAAQARAQDIIAKLARVNADVTWLAIDFREIRQGGHFPDPSQN